MANRRKSAAKSKKRSDASRRGSQGPTTGRHGATDGGTDRGPDPTRRVTALQPRSPRRAPPAGARAARKAPRPKPGGEAPTVTSKHEILAVGLWCVGLLTLLALISFDAQDASLNAAGSAKGPVRVSNWIGPVGAYWADFLLQSLGIGAFAFALVLLTAGVRAFGGKRITPGWREGMGSLFLVPSLGAFAHIMVGAQAATYPAGGVLGVLLGGILHEQFATVGAVIVSGAAVLLGIAVTADGILTGLGMKGLGGARALWTWAQEQWVIMRERRARLAERRAARAELDTDERTLHWRMGQPQPLRAPEDEEAKALRAKLLAAAAERGRSLGDEDAERELASARRRAVRDSSEPDLPVDETVDLPAEERFEMGPLPAWEPTLVPVRGQLPEDTPSPESVDRGADATPDGAKIAPRPELVPAPVAPTVEAPKALAPVPVTEMEAGDDSGSEIVPLAEVAAPGKPTPKSSLRKSNKAPEPAIVDVRPDVDVDAIERAAKKAVTQKSQSFELPSPMLLDIEAEQRKPVDPELLRERADKLIQTLKHYGILGQVREIRPGPVITMYEFVPAPGTKISKITNLADDLAMSMEALRVRIVAPIPGKGAVGIEIPNQKVETVYLKELITHRAFQKSKAKLPIALGKDIEGIPYVSDMTKMPHLLVAGATGAGKSVSVNAMIMSILFNATPEEVRLIMVDPKMLELSVYDDIPHLLLPVVTDPKKAAVALRWGVREMERRYQQLSAMGVRNIDGYNRKVKAAQEKGETPTIKLKDKLGNVEEQPCEHLPYIVIIVDELADLMMVASREVEASIMRLAQMARAAGIHLILATQRPSVDVLTGVIKANFPTRIAFQVASKHDSRTILDAVGAEHLLGRGDMLFLSPGAGGVSRVHGSFVSDEEIERTVDFVKAQGEPQYDESILTVENEEQEGADEDEPMDEMYDQAVAIVTESQQASISMIQRRLRIGYNRAARLVETMEREGVVGPGDGAKPREVLVSPAPV